MTKRSCFVNSFFEKKKTEKTSNLKKKKDRTHPPLNNKTSDHLQRITGKEQFSGKAEHENTVQEAECWLSQEQLKPRRVSLELKLLHSREQKRKKIGFKKQQGLRTFLLFFFLHHFRI